MERGQGEGQGKGGGRERWRWRGRGRVGGGSGGGGGAVEGEGQGEGVWSPNQELTKHISLHANGEPLLKRSSSHSHSSPVPQQPFCLWSGVPMVTGIILIVLFQG